MKCYQSIFVGLLFLFAACGNPSTNSDSKNSDQTKVSGQDSKIEIVATTGMIGDLLRNIAGNKANVVSLMGPGVDPHLYKATQGDLQRLTDADIVFYHGLFLEGKMEEVLKKLGKRKPVFAVTNQLDKDKLIYIEHYGNGKKVPDPHIWFDTGLWLEVIPFVADKLMDQDPENAAYYKENARKHRAELLALHEEVKKQISTIPSGQRILITAHDAFGYFGKAYDIEVKGLQGVSTSSEFGLKDVSNLVQQIISNKVKAVFVESSVPRKPLEAVIEGCKAKGHEVAIGGELFSDALGSEGTAEGTYLGAIKHNLKAIVNSLK